MRRFDSFLAAVATAALFLGGTGRAANVQFNFNSNADGWTFGTVPPASGSATPWWEWHKAPSSTDGGLQAKLLVSGSAAGAWALSPCLEIAQNKNQPYVHVDIAHYTLFPDDILGQVQFRYDAGSGWSGWAGVPAAVWSTVGGHHPPNDPNPFFPLDPGAPAFAGASPGASSGFHVTSAFTLAWAPYGLGNGDEIQFRFLVGVDAPLSVSSETILWEVNDVQIDGVRLCAVPEPDGLALGAVAVAGVARRRLRGGGTTPARAP